MNATSDPKAAALKVIAGVCATDVEALEPKTELVADLGVDSARALHLLVKLEDELGIEVDDEDVAELQTVGDILDFIDRHPAAPSG